MEEQRGGDFPKVTGESVSNSKVRIKDAIMLITKVTVFPKRVGITNKKLGEKPEKKWEKENQQKNGTV